MSFIHLNTHSYYSLGWGTDSPERLCQRAAELNCPALALTDTNNLYGLFFFLDYARTFGVRPIVGAEANFGGVRATLLVRDRLGFANLCRLLTALHTEPGFDLLARLPDCRDGLVVMTDSPALLERLGRSPYVFAELARGAAVRELLRKAVVLGVLPVATARVYWVKPEEYQLHRLLRAIHLNTTLAALAYTDCARPQSEMCDEQVMRSAFSYCGGAVANTTAVAEMCEWVPEFGKVYPELGEDQIRAAEELRRLTYAGAARRYGALSEPVRQRLERELRVIEDKGFAPVFLVVEDIVRRFPLTCGRGSAAASLVSYCLGITHVDPIRHNLFFERFINEARTEPPDIDVDFAWDEREAVLDYVIAKYGMHRVAMVANHVTFQRRAAIRETAKVYGLSEAEINAVTSRISAGFEWSGQPVTAHPGLRDHDFAPPWPEILAWAERLQDIPRHLSVHCGGVVVTPGPTSEWVPVEIAAKGVRVIQWDKDQTEESGLVKIDLLGNRSLAVIRDALRAIREHHGVVIDYAELNALDDPATQALLAKGDTMGVFYVESPATRLLQKKAGVGDYEHLVLHSSIIRPAANPFIKLYLRRLKGEPWQPLHPLLGDLLDDNYGIMVYQEDVTRVAMALAGFSLAEAEELRKIISKKHKHRRLADLKRRFERGAEVRGVGPATVMRVWDMIMSFAGYSFCKPHSASYALVSFKSAWLRAHYPAEFMAAVLSNQGGYYSPFAYVSEARRMGLKVLPPDINESDIAYRGRDGWIRVGLMQVKGLTREGMERIVAARAEDGPFAGLQDCIARAGLKASDARQLVKAGCFDRVESPRTRPEMLWEIIAAGGESATAYTSAGRGRHGGIARRVRQSALFAAEALPPPSVPQYDQGTLWRQELETLGFLVSCHPLDLYRERLERRPAVPACQLGNYVGKRVEVVGWLVTAKVVLTQNHEPMEFVTFEDTTGLMETVFFPDVFRRFSHIISHTRPYRLFGKVEEDFGAVTMTVDRVEWL